MKKLLIFLWVSAAAALLGCGGTSSAEPYGNMPEKEMLPGQITFIQHCKLCHGANGDLGLSGAANLKISVLTKEEVAQVVTNGRKAMPAWGQQLTPEQINQVSEYVLSLRR